MKPVSRASILQDQPKPSARERILPCREVKVVPVCSFQEILAEEIKKGEIKHKK